MPQQPPEFSPLPDGWQQFSIEQKKELLARQTSLAYALGIKKRPWDTQARPKQKAPDDPGHHLPDANGYRCQNRICLSGQVDADWRIYLLMGGRGTGKSQAGSNWILSQALKHPKSKWGVAAPTANELDSVVFGEESGLLRQALSGDIAEIRPGVLDYNQNKMRIRLANGSIVQGYSADRPDRIRGANLWGLLWDEAASSRYQDEFWAIARPAVRRGEARIMITTTPRNTPLLRSLVNRPDVHVTTAKMIENTHLDAGMINDLLREFGGTRRGREELDGELLEDLQGSLFRRADLDSARIKMNEIPEFSRVVVGFDPAMRGGEQNDSSGIVVVGEVPSEDGHGDVYVLDDRSLRGSPAEVARTVNEAAGYWSADCIVVESNQGGQWVTDTLRAVNPNLRVKSVHARKNKVLRAEPVANLAEQGRLHLCGVFPELEDELSGMIPGEVPVRSPDRADACIAKGTPVITARGEIPIEDVKPGDLAWTRQGWKPVTAARCTRRNAETMTVTLSDGNTLTGTPDHRVWTEDRGWQRVDALVRGDKLSVWIFPWSRLFTKASRTAGIQIPRTVPTRGITSASQTGDTFSTGIPGRMPTLARTSPQAGISTIRTRTRSTTPRQIWSCFPLPTIRTSTPGIARTSPGTWSAFVLLLLSGTLLRLATTGTSSTENNPGMAGNPSMSVPAKPNPADHLSCLTSPTRNTVPAPAGCDKQGKTTATTSGNRALSAEPGSGRTSIGTGLRPAPVNAGRACARTLRNLSASARLAAWLSPLVSLSRCTARRHAVTAPESRLPVLPAAESSCNSSTIPAPASVPLRVVSVSAGSVRHDVYDLTVADAHEFTANGVIVHNCVWAVFELRGIAAPSWLHTYGLTYCSSCKGVIKRTETECSKCGTPREAEPEPKQETGKPQGWAEAYAPKEPPDNRPIRWLNAAEGEVPGGQVPPGSRKLSSAEQAKQLAQWGQGQFGPVAGNRTPGLARMWPRGRGY